jgi:hypothetical protein
VGGEFAWVTLSKMAHDILRPTQNN